MLKQNVGSADKMVRIVVGVAALGFAAFGSGPARWFGLIGIVPLLTAAMGSCPLYTVLGFSSCPVKRPS